MYVCMHALLPFFLCIRGQQSATLNPPLYATQLDPGYKTAPSVTPKSRGKRRAKKKTKSFVRRKGPPQSYMLFSVCVRVCKCVCTCICISNFIHVCSQISIYICVCVCVCVCEKYVHMYMYIYRGVCVCVCVTHLQRCKTFLISYGSLPLISCRGSDRVCGITANEHAHILW